VRLVAFLGQRVDDGFSGNKTTRLQLVTAHPLCGSHPPTCTSEDRRVASIQDYLQRSFFVIAQDSRYPLELEDNRCSAVVGAPTTHFQIVRRFLERLENGLHVGFIWQVVTFLEPFKLATYSVQRRDARLIDVHSVFSCFV